MILDGNLVGGESTGPDDEICLLQVFSLILNAWCLYNSDFFLSILSNPVIKSFGISSQARVRVYIPVFLGKYNVTKLRVSIFLCNIDSAVEHLNLVSVQYLDACVGPVVNQLSFIIEIPFLGIKVSKTQTLARALRFCLLLVLASAAILATAYLLQRGVWEQAVG